jgi:predicted HicB family RNase H-like nuclease
MATKKSFKAGMQAQAAVSYITEAEDQAQPVEELKSKRVNLLLKPSIHERCNKIAYMSKVSFNDLVNKALEEYAQAHGDLVTKYDDTFSA